MRNTVIRLSATLNLNNSTLVILGLCHDIPGSLGKGPSTQAWRSSSLPPMTDLSVCTSQNDCKGQMKLLVCKHFVNHEQLYEYVIDITITLGGSQSLKWILPHFIFHDSKSLRKSLSKELILKLDSYLQFISANCLPQDDHLEWKSLI